MNKDIGLMVAVVFAVILACSSVNAAPASFDETGKDIRTVLGTVFDFVYDIVIILLLGATVVSAGYIIKDHFSSGTDGKSGSNGIKIAKGVVLACFVLVGVPYIINMILGA